MSDKKSKEVVKAEPAHAVSPFEEMEKRFEEFFRRPFSMFGPSWLPRVKFPEMGVMSPDVDIFEDGNDVVVKAEMPGMKKENIEVNVTDDMITVSGEKKKEQKAMQTAFVHCRAGGAALFAPDYTRENFRPSTQHGGHDGEVRSLRYLEWTGDPDPSDSTYNVDFACLLRESSGNVRVVQDRHALGLFAQAEWLRLLAEAGFEASAVPVRHGEPELSGREVSLAIKAAHGSAMPADD